jgi:hypothetical protein
VLQLVIGEEVPRELHQGFFVGAACLRIDFLDPTRFLLQRREGGLQLVEGKAFLRGAAKFGQPKDIIVVN